LIKDTLKILNAPFRRNWNRSFFVTLREILKILKLTPSLKIHFFIAPISQFIYIPVNDSPKPEIQPSSYPSPFPRGLP